ncbi:MAG: hypothetical protein ACPIOQ_85325, partial [Promethearchaeia archaeon]
MIAGKCMALKWNGGIGCLQCDRKPMSGSDLCGMHHPDPAHGRVRGPIPAKKMEEFRKKALKPAKSSSSRRWYARHLMWAFAAKMAPEIETLQGLSQGQYEACLAQTDTHIRKNCLQRYYDQG